MLFTMLRSWDLGKQTLEQVGDNHAGLRTYGERMVILPAVGKLKVSSSFHFFTRLCEMPSSSKHVCDVL